MEKLVRAITKNEKITGMINNRIEEFALELLMVQHGGISYFILGNKITDREFCYLMEFLIDVGKEIDNVDFYFNDNNGIAIGFNKKIFCNKDFSWGKYLKKNECKIEFRFHIKGRLRYVVHYTRRSKVGDIIKNVGNVWNKIIGGSGLPYHSITNLE